MAFRGTFDHTLDAKNRLTVPAKFRGTLSDGVVVAQSVERCLTIWLPADYEAYVDRALSQVNPMTHQYRELERYFNAHASETELDAAGRIMIPPKLMEWAGLSKDVVVIGARKWLEIWDRESWNTTSAELASNVPQLTEALGQA